MPKQLYLLNTLLLLLLVSCKKDNKPATAPAGPSYTSAVSNKSSYRLYEFGSISFQNSLAEGTVINATVNGNQSKLAVINDSTVAFSVFPPAYKVGANEILFESGGKSVKLSITVTAAIVVADPQVYFTGYITGLTQDLAYMRSVAMADSTGQMAQAILPSILQVTGVLNTFNTQWASLSPADKESLTQYLAANQPAFTTLKDQAQELMVFGLNTQNGLSRTMGMNGIPCETGTIPTRYKCYAAAIWTQMKDVLFFGGLAVIAGSTIPVTAWAGLGVAAVASVLAAPSVIRLAILSVKFLGFHFYIAAVVIYNVVQLAINRTSADEVVFVKNQPRNLEATIQMRNLQQTDGASSLPWVADLVKMIEKYNGLCDKLMLSECKWKFQTLNKKDYKPLDLSYITINNISNSTVTGGTIGGTLAAPTINFTSTASADQLFSFDFIYNDGVNKSIKATVASKLVINQPLTVQMTRNGKVVTANVTGGVGPYQYHWASGAYYVTNDYQTSNLLTLRNNGTYFVVVKDANGAIDTSDHQTVNDVNITNVSIARTGNFFVTLTIEWTSVLGLAPEGVTFINSTNAARLRAVVTQSNLQDEPTNLNCAISPIVSSNLGGSQLVTFNSTGGYYKINLGNSQAVQAGSFGFRLLDQINGTPFCPQSTPYLNEKFGINRVVSWQ